MNWLRWYVGTCTDAKLHKAARLAGVKRYVVIAAWAAILEEARRNDGDGQLDHLEADWLAYQIEARPSVCANVLDAMHEVGLLQKNRVTRFKSRQYESDCSTDRVRKHRAKPLNGNDTDPPGNVSRNKGETHQNRTEQNIEEKKERTETPGGVAQDLDALLYQRGKALLGHKAGGQITKLRTALGSVGAALQAIDDAQHKDSPAEYVAGIIRTRGVNGHGPQKPSIANAARALLIRAGEDHQSSGAPEVRNQLSRYVAG